MDNHSVYASKAREILSNSKNVKNDTILNHSNPDFGGINSEENINYLKNLNSSIKINKWEKSGHNIHRDFPAEFSKSILEFIEN